jgi:hypothetical protein
MKHMQSGNLILATCAMAAICTAAAGGTNETKLLRKDLAEHARSAGYSLVDEEWHSEKDGRSDAVNFADRTAHKIKLKYFVSNGQPACTSHSGRYEIRFQQGDGIRLNDNDSGRSERITSDGLVSKQCFSPDDSKLIFSSIMVREVKIYDVSSRKSEEVEAGTDATWSPDGKWIGFDDGKHYVLMDSQTRKRTQLFRTKESLGGFDHGFGIMWSPDSRYFTYTETGGSTGGFLIFGMKCPEPWRVWVWRVEDGAHDWVYQICKPPRMFQWVKDSEIVSD